jgi:hypothetical protein
MPGGQQASIDVVPNTRTKLEYGIGARTLNGNTTDLSYLRLDDDSPVLECGVLLTDDPASRLNSAND